MTRFVILDILSDLHPTPRIALTNLDPFLLQNVRVHMDSGIDFFVAPIFTFFWDKKYHFWRVWPSPLFVLGALKSSFRELVFQQGIGEFTIHETRFLIKKMSDYVKIENKTSQELRNCPS